MELEHKSADDETGHPQRRIMDEIVERKENEREPYELIREENHLGALDLDLLRGR
jgi:hypothetical protein